ncbi:zinc-dependent alcohol dehydrogenase [Pontivivens insulae]|uniref:L-threonine 3-dehydrogenase n=1 Tax=Pontivivens insulae TaxID=1639689 RepID=A0A2R8AF95_9RHOB|nr:zinc-binding alcohol dehydrogenase [Pontivivens insulae]RED12111.1 2-desacetyl-2-hydroxyethyl bacteriochlorophyllide A dehydrogenase [Pontivivens insulae]SPF30867.1 L-threonine 3-dehydrogenase [Pontivivens insulae]
MEIDGVWYLGEGHVALRRAQLGEGDVILQTLASGVSRGTERLVFEGKVPESEYDRMALPWMEGHFSFPVKYGYANVARVIEGPQDLIGAHAFSLNPHQTHIRATRDSLALLPPDLPVERATLAANMETALNAIWDSELQRNTPVIVVGAGLVGCLTAYLASRIGGADVTLIDIDPAREEIAQALGLAFCHPDAAPTDVPTAFHCSANDAGLATAINALGFEGQVIEMSWFGDRPVSVPLGGAFHANRLTIRCSQVGAVAPSRRASTNHAQRMATAIGLLDDPALDTLITHRIPFRETPTLLPARLAAGAEGIATVITY